jgi:spore maturation protein CgeB
VNVVLFCHSLASCWNHGNAHFLRGVARALVRRGHEVRVLEPADGWSRENLLRDHGPRALASWRDVYPDLESELYPPGGPDLDRVLDGADLVLVHEWTAPELVAAIGRRRAGGGRFTLLFHDTHHRAVSDPAAIEALDLDGYDGVLAFGAVLRERYLARGWARQVWVWHEAADTTVFRPLPEIPRRHDLVWVGNWGDGERSEELRRFLLAPAARLGLDASVHGVRYPRHALAQLAACGIAFRGWLPNHTVPTVFASHRVTVHVPRRPYVDTLPGIPTIRMFEALACGIPLITTPWPDIEGLFGDDCFLVARDSGGMARQLRAVLSDPDLARGLAERGLALVRGRHSCAHRVDELLAIRDQITKGPAQRRWEKLRCA